MAIVNRTAHAPRSLLPINNGGNAAFLYCFVFFRLAIAGGGEWSSGNAKQA